MRWIWNRGVWVSSSAMAVSGWNVAAPPVRRRGVLGRLSGCVAREQRDQRTAPIERDQVVAAADMGLADEDLRHRVAAGQANHVGALRRVDVEADFLHRLDAALLQKRLGALAIRAPVGAVDL